MDGRQTSHSGRGVGFTRELRMTFGRGAWGAAVLVAALLVLPSIGFAQVPGRGQAMGRLTTDGPSPLPFVLAATATENPTGVVASGNSVSTPAVGAVSTAVKPEVKPSTDIAAGAGAGAGNAPAKVPATLPDLNDTPKPPMTPVTPALPVTAGSAATGNNGAAPTGNDAAAPVKPSIEQSSIRSGGAASSGGGTTGSTASSGSSGVGTGQVIAALAIVIGLIFIGRALVRKFVPGAKGGSGKGVIEILARHPLAKNQAIVLVRIGSQIVALNQGKDSSQSVLVINDQMEVARIIGQIEGKNPNSMQAGFNKLLANARMDLEDHGEEETDLKAMSSETLDEQLEEMAAAKRQLMELRQHVRSVRDSLPRE